MRPVIVQFLKNPDIVHWGLEARFLGEDGYGSWMAVPKGARRWKGAQAVGPASEDAVLCAPHEGWWHLSYHGATSQFSHFIDIVTQPRWVSADRYEMVDLDLDVLVHQDGTVEVDDEDEFKVHQVEYGYTDDMIRRALEETDNIVAALHHRTEPFFEVAAYWLAQVATPDT